MTCILGLVEDGKVYIGGDSACVCTETYNFCPCVNGKVFRNGSFLIGFTTSFRMGQLLRYAFEPPKHEEGIDVHCYMVTNFVDGIRRCLKRGGFASKEDEVEAAGEFLVGYRGHLFEIGSNYQVVESQYGMAAIGCAFNLALGALWVQAQDIPPTRRIWRALQAAEKFSAGVCAPFTIEVLPPEGGEEDGEDG